MHIFGSKCRKQWNKITDSKWLKRINCYCFAHFIANKNLFKHIILKGIFSPIWKLLQPLVFAWLTLRTSWPLIIEIIDMLHWIFIKSICIIFPFFSFFFFNFDYIFFPLLMLFNKVTNDFDSMIVHIFQKRIFPAFEHLRTIIKFYCTTSTQKFQIKFQNLIVCNFHNWFSNLFPNEKSIKIAMKNVSTTDSIPFAITNMVYSSFLWKMLHRCRGLSFKRR